MISKPSRARANPYLLFLILILLLLSFGRYGFMLFLILMLLLLSFGGYGATIPNHDSS